MTPLHESSPQQLEARVRRFLALPAELPWIEFKENSLQDGPSIAKYVSALGNSAALHGETAGYLIWGISDARAIVGTSFSWQQAKGKGNEDLLPWLERSLSPAPQLTFSEVTIDGKLVTLLRIPAATSTPYAFDGQRWFRKGSYNKLLLDYPEAERELWRKLNQFNFETTFVAEDLAAQELEEHLNPEAFFAHRPEIIRRTGTGFAESLQSQGAATYSHELGWCIPAWSALMFAHRLSDYPQLRSLIPRVLHFSGTERTNLKREWSFDEGYATSFPKVMELFATIRPGGESVDTSGRRVVTPPLPELSFREVYANALMHQNLEDPGKFLTVEVFDDKVEVTNPGAPLVDPQRFIDTTSTTRNPHLGEALRLAQFVEQRGSGWDKIVTELEANIFPPALIRANGATTVSLSAFKPFSNMTSTERIQATYQHTVLGFLEGRAVTNASVRQRFGLQLSQSAQASRLISATVAEGLIRPRDPEAGARSMSYVPAWAD